MSKNLIVTINREFGSGGRIVGEELANKLNIQLVDELILKEAAKVMNVTENYLKKFEEKAPNVWGGLNQHYGAFQGMPIPYYHDLCMNNELYITQTALIKEMSMQQSSIFIGRCANNILKDDPNCISIFLYADIDIREKNITQVYGFEQCGNIKKEIHKVDKKRAEYYKSYTQCEWKDMSQYDIAINTGKIGLQKAVEVIINYLKQRELID